MQQTEGDGAQASQHEHKRKLSSEPAPHSLLSANKGIGQSVAVLVRNQRHSPIENALPLDDEIPRKNEASKKSEDPACYAFENAKCIGCDRAPVPFQVWRPKLRHERQAADFCREFPY